MEKEEKDKPLVSVCVFTFNSTSTIVETLDSIYNQTYENIELIISDDCSKDNTIEVCQGWLSTHSSRFRDTRIVTVEKNTGTNANVNRGYRAANGVWVKPFAGDDILKPNAIDVLVSYCIKNGCEVCISKVDFFGDDDRIAQKIISYDMFYARYKDLSVKQKYNLLLGTCVLPTPSMILSKRLIEELGYLDESLRVYEEWPWLLKILEYGYDIPYIEDKLILYRCVNGSLSSTVFDKNNTSQLYQSARYKIFEDAMKFYKEYRKPRLLKQFRFFAIWKQDTAFEILRLKNMPQRSLFQKIRLGFVRVVSPGTYVNAFMFFKTAPQGILVKKIKEFLRF